MLLSVMNAKTTLIAGLTALSIAAIPATPALAWGDKEQGFVAGVATAVRLAQIVSGATPDGKIGPKTMAALNTMDPDKFALAYALAKLARYRDIVTKDRTQQKFLLGWINRTLREAA